MTTFRNQIGRLSKGINHINPNIKSKIQKNDKHLDQEALEAGLKTANRQAISHAITLVESTIQEDQDLIAKIIQSSQVNKEAFVISVTGSPGVGKSTFINALAQHIAKDGMKVGILATDPSSEISKGSILGDKTRMSDLSEYDNIYIRPSASQNQLGGINNTTVKILDIFNIANYDYLILETVGVGQSEFSSYHLSDLFLLLLAPGGGDELQGIKRGIVEMADFICINKYDSSFKESAEITLKQYANSGRIINNFRKDWDTKYALISSERNYGISELWSEIQTFESNRKESGHYSDDKFLNRKQLLRQHADHIILDLIKSKYDIPNIIDQTLINNSEDTKSFANLLAQLKQAIEEKLI